MRLVCGHCGHENDESSAFCGTCDEYLDWSARPVRGPSAAVGAPTPSAPAPSAPTPSAPAPASAATAVTAPMPDATRSAVPTPTAPATVQGVVTAVEPPEGSRSCPRCTVVNPPERRFCRHCGEGLVPRAPLPVPPYEPWHRSWWRRLLGPRGRAERAAYRRSLSPVTRAFRVVLAAGLVAVLVLLVSPLAGDPVGWVRDQVGHQLDIGRIDPRTVSATGLPPTGGAEDGEQQEADRRAGLAVDTVRRTSWTAEWTQPATVDALRPETLPGCGKTPVGAPPVGLVVSFRPGADVREIGIESGTPDDRASWLPEVVHLTWTPEPTPDQVRQGVPVRPVCRPVTLRQTSDLQRIRVTEGRVRSLRLTVVTAFAPVEAAPGTPQRVRIGELTFWQR